MKKIDRMQWGIWALALLPLILAACCYAALPAQIPLNWGLTGGAVSYGDKSQILLIAGLSPVLAALFTALPHIDPKRRSYEKFKGSYRAFQLFLMLFMLAVTVIVLVESFFPGTVKVDLVISAMVSILFLVIGNMMPKFRQNFFCGIKTPWALSSEAVWRKTHQLGGWMFFLGGIVGLLGLLIPPVVRFGLMIATVAAIVIIPSVMSYVWFRGERERD